MTADELKSRTKLFALRVMNMTDALPNNPKGWVLSKQILRSSTSVAAGYRPACRARSKADWVDKIGRILEEIDESLVWLELIQEGKLLAANKLKDLLSEVDELTAIFVAIHKSSKSEILNQKS